MTRGFIVGKFAPLTTGHIHFINEASRNCDELLVLLSFDTKWLSEQPEHLHDVLTLENRLTWLHETFQDSDKIIVDYVDESDIRPPPYGWADFSGLVNEKIEKHFETTHCEHTYTSEPSYDEGFKEHFPNTKHVLIDPDRNHMPISATMVRESPNTYWSYIPEAVRKDFGSLRSQL